MREQPRLDASYTSGSPRDRWRWSGRVLSCALFVVSVAVRLEAATLNDLATGADWRVASIRFEGNDEASSGELTSHMLTKKRPWYTPWKERPAFDPVTFSSDLERLKRFYESRGYYLATIDYDLEIDEKDALVAIRIRVSENEPVRVGDVEVRVEGPRAELPLPALAGLPLRSEEVFVEDEYQKAEREVRDFFLQHGHAHVRTQRQARVDLTTRLAQVQYSATPGPVSRFGETIVTGTKDVEPVLVRRELTYKPGERYSLTKLQESRAYLLGLDLFRAVRVTPELDPSESETVPIRIEVEEKPLRHIRVGAGYGTDDGPRGQIQWRHQNWLGGGRRLSFQLKGSQINREAGASFVQPHLMGRAANRGGIDFRLFQDEEDTYSLYAAQLIPRFEHRLTPALMVFVGYRVEYDKLGAVDQATIDAIGGFKDKGVLSAPLAGLLWDTTEDPLDPLRGEVISLQLLQGGTIWGGAFSYWRAVAEAKKYVPIGWQAVLAGRVKLGFADSIGSIENLPLSERLFAGGERSVRGYGRRRLGPLSVTDRPLGGRSLFEGSVELRRPIWRELGGAVFLDFGAVSLSAFDPPIDSAKLAPGFGLAYKTPVGPLRLDIGFPLDPPPGDPAWQLHFSIGQFF